MKNAGWCYWDQVIDKLGIIGLWYHTRIAPEGNETFIGG